VIAAYFLAVLFLILYKAVITFGLRIESSCVIVLNESFTFLQYVCYAVLMFLNLRIKSVTIFQ